MDYQKLVDWVSRAGNIVWGTPTVIGLMGIGAVLTVQNGFLQFRQIRLWLGATLGQLVRPHRTDGITRVQALATALAGTMGTGNLIGVAIALSMGGPGAVFWMWASAAVGMMIKYGETVLAVKYRRRTDAGWSGGTMEVLEDVLHWPWLATLFAAGCVLASFGMGNMAQANAISQAMRGAFGLPEAGCGVICAGLTAAVICGGLKRISAVAEKLIPLLSLAYGIGGILVILTHANRILPAFGAIFSGAFAPQAAVGGLTGSGIAAAMRHGFANGIFSNEAGLGSSAMAYAAADDAQPVAQGFWAIFEVFADTFVVCTVTALAILTSGTPPQAGADWVMAAFSTCFGQIGGQFVALAIALFAFASMLGWAYYGIRGFTRLGGSVRAYQILFVLAAFAGCVARLELVWNLSELFNAGMALPNLIAVVRLAPVIRSETRAALRAPQKTRSVDFCPKKA